jgi:hypothetical protein
MIRASSEVEQQRAVGMLVYHCEAWQTRFLTTWAIAAEKRMAT